MHDASPAKSSSTFYMIGVIFTRVPKRKALSNKTDRYSRPSRLRHSSRIDSHVFA